MQEKILILTLEEAYDSLMTPLSMKKGVNFVGLEKFITIVKLCKEEWANKDTIPKKAASIFVDAYSTMMSLADLYDGAECESVFKAADDVRDIIQEVLMSS